MVYDWPFLAELVELDELLAMEKFYADADPAARAAIVGMFVPLLTSAVAEREIAPVFDALEGLGLIDEHGRVFFDAVLDGGPASWWEELAKGAPMLALCAGIRDALQMSAERDYAPIGFVWLAVGAPTRFKVAVSVRPSGTVTVFVASPEVPAEIKAEAEAAFHARRTAPLRAEQAARVAAYDDEVAALAATTPSV